MASKKKTSRGAPPTPNAPPALRDWLGEIAAKAGLDEAARASLQGWLTEQLVADEFAKLGQGGHTETRVPLRRVFVDLPMSEQPLADTDTTSHRVRFLETLSMTPPAPLREACALSPVAIDEPDVPVSGARGRRIAGYLLIGGPGQGKSTLGQLACQVHRAALLRAHAASLSFEARNVITPFEATGGAGVALPPNPLLPLRIVLPDAASWLARSAGKEDDGEPSPQILLRFVADQPSARKAKLDAETLWALITTAPCLIILDGFDEVGAVADRDRTVAAIRRLLLDLADRGARALVVATTRPQGYAGELSRIGVQLVTRYLAQLRTDEALDYGRRVIEAKIASADQQAAALAQLELAAAEPATERLLRTPLQVTILTALVQQKGRVPSERWRLFGSYFDFTYNREIERETYASRLLAEHRPYVEEIHRRVGLLLQTEGENAGGAAARMSRDRLQEVAGVVLQEDEIDEDKRHDLVKRIVDAAEFRLVFLVEPEPGSFGFEIRSLQEFMAAWALTQGPDAAVEARLLQIAKAPLFRNVLLFAASRLFSDRASSRDMFAERICPAVDADAGDAVARIAKAGAQLALEVLEEGSAQLQPKRARALMERAVALLDFPPGIEHARLARAATPDTAPVLQSAIQGRLGAGTGDETAAVLSAWVCLVEATNLDAAWAERIANEWWDNLKAPSRVLTACNEADMLLGRWIVSKIETAPERFEPNSIIGSEIDERTVPEGSWVRAVLSSMAYNVHRERVGAVLSFYAPGARACWRRLAAIAHVPPPFQAWMAIARFGVAPSARTLSEALRVLASTSGLWKRIREFQSWPITACLTAAADEADLVRFADALDNGILGDRLEWEAAEQGWGGKSFSWGETTGHINRTGLPWDVSTLRTAPPFAALMARQFYGHHERSRAVQLLEQASALAQQVDNSPVRKRLLHQCLALTKYLPPEYAVGARQAREWVFELINWSPAPWAILPAKACLPVEQWLSLADEVGCRRELGAHCEEAVDACLAHPERLGLLRLAEMYITRNNGGPRSFRPAASQISRLGALVAKRSYVDSAARADAALLRISTGVVTRSDVPRLMADIFAQIDLEPNLEPELLRALGTNYLQDTLREDLVLKTYEALRARSSGRVSEAVRLLRTCLRARRSDLALPAAWNRLQLPLPYPAVPVASEPRSALPEAPVALRSIRVRHLRILADFDLDLTIPPSDNGQWVFVLGPNGAGKTTLLRSVALALRNLATPAIWPTGAFANRYRAYHGPGEATVTVEVHGGATYTTTIRGNDTETFFQDPPLDAPRLFPLFAYGCRRGSALGMAREVNLQEDGGPEIASLFDHGAGLIHAETWLSQWEGEAAKTARGKVVFEAARGALQKLLDVDRIEIRGRQLYVTSPHVGGTVPFGSLSDGYLTSASWFLDLIARWIELAVKHDVPLNEHFMERMTGLVLIDEIDLHLHPAWQIEIVKRVRDMLPRMSFMVTTHNPLTLVGAKPEEIWILAEEDGRVRPTRGTEAPMLLTGGQIYSRYFGIQDLYPHELGKKLRRYGFLSGYALRDDAEDKEMVELREALKKEGIEPGWEEVPREPLPEVKPKRAAKKPAKGRGKAK
jgi:energy-coupling factor transporter ATP-binding protein EcfA2